MEFLLLIFLLFLLVLVVSLILSHDCPQGKMIPPFPPPYKFISSYDEAKKEEDFYRTHKQVGYLKGKRVKKKDLNKAMRKAEFTWVWVKKKV